MREVSHKKSKHEGEKTTQGPRKTISNKKATERQDLRAIIGFIQNSLVSVNPYLMKNKIFEPLIMGEKYDYCFKFHYLVREKD